MTEGLHVFIRSGPVVGIVAISPTSTWGAGVCYLLAGPSY